jgi:ATP-dependent exoDNAse (exonuclease V) beta subunit
LVIHVEAPLLRPLPDGACEEGFIDLAAFDPAKGSWLVLDWKTNLVGAEELPHLLRFYAPQIREYVEAIRAATASGDVAGGLYSTACGKLLEL